MANWKRLKENADIHRVVDALGIEVTQKGAAYFMYCPNPAHDDHHATNCYFYDGWNHVYCQACGEAYYAFDIIAWTLGCSIVDAVNWLYHLEGEPDWFEEKKRTKNYKHFFVRPEDCQLIGLHPTGKVVTPVCVRLVKDKELPTQLRKESRDRGEMAAYRYCSFGNEELHQYYSAHPKRPMRSVRPERNDYTLMKVQSVTYSDFLSEPQWVVMVMNKAKEAMCVYVHMNAFKEAGRCRKLYCQAKKFYEHRYKKYA